MIRTEVGLGVDFTWQAGDAGPVRADLPSEPRSPLRWWRRLLAVLLPLAAVSGLVAWRIWQGQEAAQADLQRVVELEVAALAAGQREEFLSLLAHSTPFYWYNYHDASFYQESAWFAARGAARVRVERVRLAPGRATVDVALDDGANTWRGTWYYQRIDGEWRHAAPPATDLDERHTAVVGQVTVTAQGLGEEEAAGLAAELDALCYELMQHYGLSPGEALAPDEGPGEPPSPLRVDVEVLPSHSNLTSNWSVGGDRTRLSIAAPSPQLALELRTPAERNASVRRSVRLAVASELLLRSGRNYLLGQALALWHARAWEPEWEASARTALAEGTWRRYLELWWEPESTEDEEWWRDLLGRYEGASEEDMLKAFGDWMGAMSYNLGEYLVTACPRERLGALLQVAEPARVLGAELGLTREELQAGWGAFLQERYGGGETADGGR